MKEYYKIIVGAIAAGIPPLVAGLGVSYQIFIYSMEYAESETLLNLVLSGLLALLGGYVIFYISISIMGLLIVKPLFNWIDDSMNDVHLETGFFEFNR